MCSKFLPADMLFYFSILDQVILDPKLILHLVLYRIYDVKICVKYIYSFGRFALGIMGSTVETMVELLDKQVCTP